eukprot:COSAG02_NODE_40111_length_409_cov_0.774194_1_plen_36_part_10
MNPVRPNRHKENCVGVESHLPVRNSDPLVRDVSPVK